MTRFLLVLSALLGSLLNAKAEQPPHVNISFPYDGALIRANIPIFGTACLQGGQTKFKGWFLEYGAGRSPSTWTRIKESTQEISKDPYLEGKVVWNVNKEPTGNLTNWAVGLASYSYATWGKNLNGIYTLRLVAETESGTSAEVRKTFYVGEAVIRLYGGTGISADLRCRLLIPPFAFDGEQARVVAIVKQLPPSAFGSCKTLRGVEETDPAAAAIYQSTSGEFQLQSAIYRIYPNSLETEPPATLEIDADPGEFAAVRLPVAAVGEPMLYQWSPVAHQWSPLATSWFGTTAKSQVGRLSEEASYVAVMKRLRPATAPAVSWHETSALSGYWTGTTSSGIVVRVVSSEGKSAECRSDENGSFRLEYQLSPGFNSCRLELLTPEGRQISPPVEISQRSGEVAIPQSCALRPLGESTFSAASKTTILCQIPSLADTSIKRKRSVVARAQTATLSQTYNVELAETVAGSGNFVGCIASVKQRESVSEDSLVTTYLPLKLTQGTTLIVSVGTAALKLNVIDSVAPRITLKSSTHPCLLFASPDAGEGLTSARLHSSCDISVVNDGWKLGGLKSAAISARIANWPTNGFSVAAWPLVGFTYKLYGPAPWQLMLRSANTLQSFHLGCQNSVLEPYSASEALATDGSWHHWERNLSDGKFKQVDALSFGSWIKTGFLRAEPGFVSYQGNPILIKDLWIGRSYTDHLVEMAWNVEDDSAINKLEWWLDQEPDSVAPDPRFASKALAAPLSAEGKCQFTVPSDGRWFFHVRAADAAGNVSSTLAYPLLVYAGMGQAGLLANVALAPPASLDLTWEQPDGVLHMILNGFGLSLDPSTLAMEIRGRTYPLQKVNWNSGSESLTLTAASFGGTLPLGFNGETLTADLLAKDVRGKPISNLPRLQVHVKSPFFWMATETGGNLKIANSNAKNPWMAFWGNVVAPWMEWFPGCTNNVLVLTRTSTDSNVLPVHWLRPMTSSPKSVQNLCWEESWSDFASKIIPAREALSRPNFSCDGSVASAPQSILSDASRGDSWVYIQTPADPFDRSTLRLVTRTPEKAIILSRVTKNELLAILNTQGKNALRIDGWLPPNEGSFRLKLPGKRDLQYASGTGSLYKSAPNNEVRIAADDAWLKFSVLVLPAYNSKTTAGALIGGTFYW